MVALGLSFKNSGLDLDRKICQSPHLCRPAGPLFSFIHFRPA